MEKDICVPLFMGAEEREGAGDLLVGGGAEDGGGRDGAAAAERGPRGVIWWRCCRSPLTEFDT